MLILADHTQDGVENAPISKGFGAGIQGWFSVSKPINKIHCIRKSEEKNDIIIETDIEKAHIFSY